MWSSSKLTPPVRFRSEGSLPAQGPGILRQVSVDVEDFLAGLRSLASMRCIKAQSRSLTSVLSTQNSDGCGLRSASLQLRLTQVVRGVVVGMSYNGR